MSEKIDNLYSATSDVESEKIRNKHNQEYQDWCENKLTNYFNEWQEVLNGKYDEIGTLKQHGIEVKTLEQKRKYVATRIADMLNDVSLHFFHGGHGWHSDDEMEENLDKIKEKLLLMVDKLGVKEELESYMPQKKEEKEPVEVPEWLKL